MSRIENLCETCLFWVREPVGTKSPYGICKRYPPSRTWNEEAFEMETCQPYTDKEDWCGEWKPKEVKA